MEEVLSRIKLFSHMERVDEWLERGITRPITVEIDPTNYCNHSCNSCAGNRLAEQAYLSRDSFDVIIEQLAKFVKGIIFTGGGEPLLNPSTQYAIHSAKSKGIDIGLVTNGDLLDCVNINQLVDDCSWIRVSVDAADPDMYSKRRGTLSQHFYKVWENVKLLSAAKKEIGSPCVIGAAYLTDNDSIEDLRAFAMLAKTHGVDYAQFRPYHTSSRNLVPEIEQLQVESLDSFEVICSRDRYERTRFVYKQAFADEFRTVISADGTMYPCCFTRGVPQFAIGNILEQDFEEIWMSEKRGQVERGKLKQPLCSAQCYQDPLNQVLWEVKVNPDKVTSVSALEGQLHVNFV
jgi:GTP 3',8-cyclase